jgi:hypothetical protein
MTQKLLLLLGGPLVIAFMLLAIAKFVRGLMERFKHPHGMREEVYEEPDEEPDDEAHTS